MIENNLPFVTAAVVLTLLLIYWFIPVRLRKILILATSLGMLAAADVTYTALMIGHVSLTFLGSYFVSRLSKPRNKYLFFLLVLWLIGALVSVKAMIGASWQAPVIATIGLSYITFRLIHYVVLAYKQEIKITGVTNFFDLLSHVLFFPSLIAGPVLYYESWTEQKPPQRINYKEINYSLLRILLGVFKKFVLSDQLNKYLILPVLAAPEEHSGIVIAGTICADFIRIFLDFSGYSDIAIGSAGLFGYKLPENFNYPLIRSNIAEFWRSWHITLHDFIRDHIFFPFFAYRASPTKVYIGLFTTMCLMMLWHAFSYGFLILGILNGIALAFWHFLQQMKKRNKKLAVLFDSKPATVFCIILTFLFSSFSAVFGFRGLEATLALYSTMLGF